ncbi:hypothetical protein M9H77_20684 [Catharanthus roseus]|uniref:Uncharacterized protein n=1 Tax=Catharanthus roseus TaxID=4058 RepID=A0ACC0AKW7_CATRO|nr:hypothetical protein M9H77_20684 [Catharanthus roseus]
MATSESWQLFVHNGRHNHKVAVYNHGHAQAARLMKEQLHQNEQFRKSHVPPHNILRFLREQDVGCAVSAQKIYNVIAKIKRNRMSGRNTVEEVLCLSAQRGYTVFHSNREENNILSDIVVAHPISIAMIRTWPYILIMDTTKIGKSSGSSSRSGSGSGSGSGPSPRGRGRPPRSGRGRGRGHNSGRSSLSSVVNPDAPSMLFPFNNAFPGFIYEFILNWKNVVGDGGRIGKSSAPADYWMDTPDHLYIIADTFNLCVVFLARLGSTTFLPLVSNMDGNAGTIFIGFIEEQKHFIQLHLRDECPLPPLQVQWTYHRDVRVSGWAVPYQDRILDWVARYHEMYPPQSHSHVIIN